MSVKLIGKNSRKGNYFLARLFIFIYLSLGIFYGFLQSDDLDTFYIPEDCKIDNNAFIESHIRDLSKEDIFILKGLYVYDNYIYIPNIKPIEIVKLNLNGKVLARAGKKGQGPGEFFDVFSEIKIINDQLGCFDYFGQKLSIYSKDLKFVNELKLKKEYITFFQKNADEIVLCTKSRNLEKHYFHIYDMKGNFVRVFGCREKIPSSKILTYDVVQSEFYLSKEDRLWVSMFNRYLLQCYKKEKLVAEVKTSKSFFKSSKREMMGYEYLHHPDRSVYITTIDNFLIHFYRKDKELFCDIINIDDQGFNKRLRCPRNYKYIAHHKNNVFYAVHLEDEEFLILSELKLILAK